MPAIGTSAIYTSILPNQYKLERLDRQRISREAKFRLQVIDFYYHKANCRAELTCRHFMVSRSFLYKWLKRFNPKHLPSLESKSRKPHHARSVTYDEKLVDTVRTIRQQDPSFSAVKIAVILSRDYAGDVMPVSAATIGRIIKKFNLFFSRMVRLRKRLSDATRRSWAIRRVKERKPYGLKAMKPHQVIEFDMKHITLASQKQYAFCAIDPYTKQAVVHIASSPSSSNARVAIDKVIAMFGEDITILNDNGSENMGTVYDLLKEKKITQYFARPYTPKDKPYIENFIGKLQKECLDEDDRAIKTVSERQNQINKWINDFHFYRPHQALGYKTPQEFCDTFSITIPRMEVSLM